MISVTIVDLETTGMDHENNEIVEMAAIRTQAGDGKLIFEESGVFKVLPKKPVNPRVAEINGYDYNTWIHSGNLKDFPSALGEIFRLMTGSWHAGSNPDFDARFLKKAAENLCWLYPQPGWHTIDITAKAISLFMDNKIKHLRQEDIGKFLGIEGGGHRAFEDALQCAKIFAKLENLELVNF